MTYYTTSEAAKELGVRQGRTIKEWIKKGDLKALKSGSRYKIPESEIKKYKRERTT
jgi:excisionase family DNA binding protein